LAALRLRDKQYDEAAKLYQLASRKDPNNSKWIKALARVYLESGDQRRLGVSLEQLVQMDADELVFRKKLAQLSLEGKDYKSAARWAGEALQIDVMDAGMHWIQARALVETQQPDKARTALEDLLKIDADHEEAKELMKSLK
jgi:predicted Zn-dependent protease